jgi:hypothetical protein
MKKLLPLAITLVTATTSLNAIELPAENCIYDNNNYVLVSPDFQNTTKNPLAKVENFLFTAVLNGEVIGSRISPTIQLFKTESYRIKESNLTTPDWTLRHSKELKSLIIKNDKPEYKDFLLQKVGDEFVELHNHYYLTEEDKAKLIENPSNYNNQRDQKFGVIPAFNREGVAFEICFE